MKDHPEEKRGRRWLAALLLLNLLLTALERTLPVWPYRSGPVLLLAAAGLLPTAVVLWGLLRGSWPALAVFCIGAVRGVGDLVGLLQFGGVSALDRATALTLVVLLSRITVLLALFRAGRRQPLLGAAPPAPPPRGPGPGGRSGFCRPLVLPSAWGAAARRVFLRKPLTLREKGLVKGQKR